MGGIWTPGAPWGPKRQKRPIIPICLWHMFFCSASRATKEQTHERLKAPGSAYLSERGGGLQQSSPSNTASAKAEAQRLMQPALHPVMQAASCRLQEFLWLACPVVLPLKYRGMAASYRALLFLLLLLLLLIPFLVLLDNRPHHGSPHQLYQSLYQSLLAGVVRGSTASLPR